MGYLPSGIGSESIPGGYWHHAEFDPYGPSEVDILDLRGIRGVDAKEVTIGILSAWQFRRADPIIRSDDDGVTDGAEGTESHGNPIGAGGLRA